MAKKDKIEVVRGSGNVFRDFGDPDADVRQTKAILAARIIGILDDRALSINPISHASATRNLTVSRSTGS
jgi:hypothetical protein